jgi:hypothetical protein
MNFLFLAVVGIFFLGIAALVLIKRKIETLTSIIWWIAGTTAWGIVNISLVVWSFHTNL